MTNFGSNFGRLIRERRGIEGLSQEELAVRSGLTKSMISRLENGHIDNPQVRTIDALCVALDITGEDRISCHQDVQFNLSMLLLENLALRFGDIQSKASEEQLVEFLQAKAAEYTEMRDRLIKLSETDEKLSNLLSVATAAINEGRFEDADNTLLEAENAHLESITMPVLVQQASLRRERGSAALLSGDPDSAASHFEAAASYFAGIDRNREAETRFEYVETLRFYAFRYSDPKSLYLAQSALTQNLEYWAKATDEDQWCKTKNALGGVLVRLSEFDIPENCRMHLLCAKEQYDEVRKCSSDTGNSRRQAVASLDLANVFSSPNFSKSNDEHRLNVIKAIEMQKFSLEYFDKKLHPFAWGVVHHNLGCTHIRLAKLSNDRDNAIASLSKAVGFLERSFDVRTRENNLQHWVASCRSLGEALLDLSLSLPDGLQEDKRCRALNILKSAKLEISKNEHPHQWNQLNEQLSRPEA